MELNEHKDEMTLLEGRMVSARALLEDPCAAGVRTAGWECAGSVSRGVGGTEPVLGGGRGTAPSVCG